MAQLDDNMTADVDGYRLLAIAICEKAVQDLNYAYNHTTKTSQETIEDCESFFLSDWFVLLSGLDGKSAITAIKASALKRKRAREQRQAQNR